ncbi:MAG: class II aldolase [Clostridiales bacterium]|nr:class II aldolase [Clostridiales bacterium]
MDNMEEMMQGFIKISKYAGMREDLVQAGGGNSSYKETDTRMYIKASGFQLAEVSEKEGYAVVNPQKIQAAFLNQENLDQITDEVSREILQSAFIEGKRPSIETFLHAVSGRYTLHTHPIVVNAMTCRKQGMDVLAEMFPEALIVPYATPGVELAKSFFLAYRRKAQEKGQIFDIVFLQNHGLVVSGDSAQIVIDRTEEVVRKLERYLKADMQPYHVCTELWEYFREKVVWRVTDQHVLEVFHKTGHMWKHSFCPDCVVFMGKNILNLTEQDIEAALEKFQKEYGSPVILIYDDNMYIVADSVKKALEIQSVLSFSAQVMKLNENVECTLLDEREQNFLLNWDAEKYRKNIK